MSFLSKLFNSDPWRDIERKAKASRKALEVDFTAFIIRQADDILELLLAVILAEKAKRELK